MLNLERCTLPISVYSRRAITVLVLWFLPVVLTALAQAQQGTPAAPVQASYEGQNVSSVDFVGRPDVARETLEPLLVQQAGDPYSQSKVDATAKALKATGRFQNVGVEVHPETDGVRLNFVLEPALYFGVYQFPGALRRFPYSRLLQITNYPAQAPYSATDVENARVELVKFFQRAGNFEAKVQTEVQADQQQGLANVIFHVDLGRRAKFGEVIVEGYPPQEVPKLLQRLRSVRAKLRGAHIKKGKPYSFRKLQVATQFLESSLAGEKRLAARVEMVSANYHPDTNLADVTFRVTAGPVIGIKVTGAHIWSWRLHKLIPIYQEEQVNEELIQEGERNIQSYLQSKGFFEARVDTRVESQNGQNTDITYNIVKGPRHKVHELYVTGNNAFEDKELLARSALEKGRLFSHGKYSDQLVRKAVTNITNLYKNAGYSQVKVTPDVTKPGGNIDIALVVDEGPRDYVQELRIEGNDTLPAAKFAPRGLKLAPGKPFSQQLLQQDRNEILAHYLSLGYLTASFVAKATPIPGDPHHLQVVYTIHEGPQVYTSNVFVVGRERTREDLALKSADIKAKKPLSETSLLTGESRLYTMGVYDWAEVDPRRPITTQLQEAVIVKVHESKRNSMTYGFGFEVINRGGSVPSGTVAVPGLPPVGLPSTFKTSQRTFYGPRGSFEYTRRALRGTAESFSIGGLAGRLDQRATATYLDPLFRGSSWNASVTSSGEHNGENPIFTAMLGTGGLQFQKYLDANKSKSAIIRYNFQYTSLSNLTIPDLVPPEDRKVRLSSFSGSFLRDTRDNLLDAHKGIYESLELSIFPTGLGSSVDFARLLAQTSYYKDIGAKYIFANSIRIGLEQPFNGSRVPLSEKFFTGGGSTLRGFPLDGAGPQRTIPACGNPSNPSTCTQIQVPVGGAELFIVNSELRTPPLIPVPFLGKLGLVAFYDGGNIYDRVGFHNFFSDFTNSIGAGVRYATPVGPIRIDIGHNLNRLPGIKSTQVFITLGQAF